MSASTKSTTLPRIALIDVLRGLALVAMTIYHFTWDLEFFGFLLPATTLETGWVIFARSIAASFLFLVGVSLVLAHGAGIRWRSFWVRFMQVAIAAGVITLITWLIFPQGFIFFGILHAIALFSLIGLLFLRAPWFVTIMAALAVFLAPRFLTLDVFQPAWLWWLGLMPNTPTSNDFVPLFPWLAATLAGVAAGRLAQNVGLWPRLSDIQIPSFLNKPLSFIGRHSLVYYLVHQPVMMGLLWAFIQVAGPPDRTEAYTQICTQQCVPRRGEIFCKPYCSCLAEGLKRENLFNDLYDGKITFNTSDKARVVHQICAAAQDNE